MKRTSATLMTAATLTAMLTLLPAARAAQPNTNEAAKALAAADRDAQSAEKYRKESEAATGELKDALIKAAEARTVSVEARRKQSAAYASGDEEARKLAEAEFPKADRQWRHAAAVLEVRIDQAGIQAAQGKMEKLTAGTPPENKALLDALVAARQKKLDAGNAFVAAITPDSSRDDTEIARDPWIQANDELVVADTALNWANERAKMASGKGAADPAVAAKLAEIAKIDEENLAARKASKAANLQVRILDRKRAAAMKEFDTLRQNAAQ